MNLRALETLTEILLLGSFSKVAEARNMTLSAVSMQMKSLEQELGVALFDRERRPPKLTPLGRRVAEHSKSVLRERDALTALCQASGVLQGTFHIGFIPTASVRLLPAFLALVKNEEPHARFQISAGVSETLTRDVEDGLIDAAVVTQVEMTGAKLSWEKIVTEEMVLIAPKSCLSETEDDLTGELPFIQFRPTSGIGRLISAAIAERDPQPAERMIMDSIEGSINCVKLGLGYTILPKPDVERYFDSHLKIVRSHGDLPSRDMVLVTRDGPQAARWSGKMAGLMRRATAV